MVTTRRANGIMKPAAAATPSSSSSTPYKSSPLSKNEATSATTMPASPIPQSTHSPFLPTHIERLLALAYPLTLLAGSLFSHLSPSIQSPANSSTYSSIHQSFQPASNAPSYFAQKRNIFNLYFVKISWFWCTLGFFAFLALVSRGRGAQRRRTGEKSDIDPPTTRTVQWSQDAGLQWRQERDSSDARLRRVYQAFLRWALATSFWVLTTQWFFGPPLVDRGFALTGGACALAAEDLANKPDDLRRAAEVAATHAACRLVGGRWHGGYDISGHVFILVLGSGMLWMEMLPFLFPSWKGLGVGRVVREFGKGGRKGVDVRVANELGAAGAELYRARSLDPNYEKEPVKWTAKRVAQAGALSIAALSWWMLLMTAAFFHEWVEKLTAGILAFAGLWIVYILPRGLPTFRAVVGMPGV